MLHKREQNVYRWVPQWRRCVNALAMVARASPTKDVEYSAHLSRRTWATWRRARRRRGSRRCSRRRCSQGSYRPTRSCGGSTALSIFCVGLVKICEWALGIDPLPRRLNAHVASLLRSCRGAAAFQMPAEVVGRALLMSFDSHEAHSAHLTGRLSSFGFSGTIAHGLFSFGH